MCRFLAYSGCPEVMNELLYEPSHSLIKQSYKAREMKEPLNGDGFGVGWYERNLNREPAIFTSVSPAWNNRNLRYLAPKIKSNCMFAHVRAATVGHVSEANCHPFHYGNFLMMHNGGIRDFDTMKRPLLGKLSDDRFRWVKGQTDSEHIFALFLDHLLDKTDEPGLDDFCIAFRMTFSDLQTLADRCGNEKPMFLNLMVTNGDVLAGSRYVSDSSETPHSLYHSEGKKYVCEDGHCKMIETENPEEKAILVVSETLSDITEDWIKVPANHFIKIDENLECRMEEISF